MSYLLALGYPIMRIIRMSYPLWYCPSRTERVHRPQRAGKRIRRERIEVAICVGFRNNFRRREEVLQHTVLCLVDQFMCALIASISINVRERYGTKRVPVVWN